HIPVLLIPCRKSGKLIFLLQRRLTSLLFSIRNVLCYASQLVGLGNLGLPLLFHGIRSSFMGICVLKETVNLIQGGCEHFIVLPSGAELKCRCTDFMNCQVWIFQEVQRLVLNCGLLILLS